MQGAPALRIGQGSASRGRPVPPFPVPPVPALSFAAPACLVREPWPSQATGAAVTHGRLGALDRLRVVSRMNGDGVVFADGIEKDRLAFPCGAGLQVGVAEQRLRLVQADRAVPAARRRRRAGGQAMRACCSLSLRERVGVRGSWLRSGEQECC